MYLYDTRMKLTLNELISYLFWFSFMCITGRKWPKTAVLGDSLTEENTLSNSLNNSFEEELGHPFSDFEGRQLCSTPKKTLRNIDLHVTCAANSQSLGVSLWDDDLLCTTELGTSLVSDEPGVIDSECVMLEKSMDYKISDLGTSFVYAEPDMFDPDFICNVRATPKAIPTLVFPKICEYVQYIFKDLSCMHKYCYDRGNSVCSILLTKPALCKVGFDQAITANNTFH